MSFFERGMEVSMGKGQVKKGKKEMNMKKCTKLFAKLKKIKR